MQIRKLDQHRDVLAFRVDRYDEAGNRLAPVAVAFRSYEAGQVSDGEETEVRGRWTTC